MKHINKNLIYILVLSISLIIYLGCDTEDDPGTPIFSDVEAIHASFDGTTFTYSPTDDTKYIVVGIFVNPIQTSEKSILNMGDMRFGTHTGKLDMTRSSVLKTKVYTYVDPDFTTQTGVTGSGITYYWAVWGFNADWTIICASKQNSFVNP